VFSISYWALESKFRCSARAPSCNTAGNPAKELTMTASSKNLLTRTLRASLFALALGIPMVVAADQPWYSSGHDSLRLPGRDQALLAEKVRKATAKYRDINVALNEQPESWVQATPCVSGPSEGAMGVHLVKPSRIHDGTLKSDEPEALIYEPLGNGAFRLVGVEFIVIASEFAALNPGGGTPEVDGHLTNLVTEPNRYGLPSFYELHVWAWENNPKGTFADWNTQVTCDRQPGE
jgi:hypothetical protein